MSKFLHRILNDRDFFYLLTSLIFYGYFSAVLMSHVVAGAPKVSRIHKLFKT